MPSFAAAGAACPGPFPSSVVPSPPGLGRALLGTPLAVLLAWRDRRLRCLFALVVGFSLFGGSDAKADMIFVGGYGFQENAFATSVESTYSSNPRGGFVFGPLAGGMVPSSLSQAVVGPYLGDFALNFDNMSYLQLGFAVGIRNGPGADLALFETGVVLDRFALSLSPSTSSVNYSIYQTTFTNTYFGAQVDTNRINVALVDLSSLGVQEGARLDSITVGLYTRTGDSRPTFTAAGAFSADSVQPSAVPAPPALVLALAGAPFIGFAARRNWRQQVVGRQQSGQARAVTVNQDQVKS